MINHKFTLTRYFSNGEGIGLPNQSPLRAAFGGSKAGGPS